MARFDVTYNGPDLGISCELAEDIILFDMSPLNDSLDRLEPRPSRARPGPKKLTRKIRNSHEAPPPAWHL